MEHPERCDVGRVGAVSDEVLLLRNDQIAQRFLQRGGPRGLGRGRVRVERSNHEECDDVSHRGSSGPCQVT